MKVDKLKKLSGNKYVVEFDNGIKVKLYDDIIIKYNLLSKKDIADDFLLIEKENEEREAYYVSLNYIKRRLRCESEIRKYLFDKKYDARVIEDTITKLKEEEFLNEKKYISAYINDRINLSNDGYYRIYDDLKKLGLSEEDIYNELDKIEKTLWDDKLRKLISKKIKSNSKYSGNKLKQKINYDLVNLGYSKDIIDGIINEFVLKDDALLQKELEKIKVILKRKYSGKELSYQIRNKLYQKGFNIDDINNYLSQEKF